MRYIFYIRIRITSSVDLAISVRNIYSALCKFLSICEGI